MATIHAFLRQQQDDQPDTVNYGPSTNNKVEAGLSHTHIPKPFIVNSCFMPI